MDRHIRDDHDPGHPSRVALKMYLLYITVGGVLAIPFTICWFVWPRVRDEMIWITIATMIVSMIVRIGLTWRY